VVDHLRSRPFPHNEPNPKISGTLIRIEVDGKRTVGRFTDREFKALD